ncbi:sugar phosphate isomerase/epimerase [Anaerovorax odorimutans]|uniref:Sugar phosphate isomerase/epimerase n=1 Tax=Anaerovorax odorimutans TaxID=109327 RepID=A0ABT1RSW5_9FIRM|nr:sugar phosphate isomerase/epimerase family protein [Anaerovorax odorimutans]MCQ4638280.1 sugar phosphate isomerase/epimerase [Anaerovorax odorimutans]
MYENKIIASHWAIAGNHYCGDHVEIADTDFKERMEVIGRIGFKGAGFVEADLLNTKEKYGYKEARKIAEANGITEIEVEVLDKWWDYDNKEAQESRKNVFEAAEQLGARHIKVFGSEGDVEKDKFIEEFVKLCKDAEAIGTKIAMEFMPFKADMDCIKKGLEVFRAAGMKNAGFCLDTWHTFMGPSTYDDIALIKPEEIVTVELVDGYAELVSGSLWRDTCDYRLPAGEGDFNCKDFIGRVLDLGYKGTIGCEIIAIDHRELPLKRAAARAYASVKQYL